jgi:TonB family protein
MVIPYKQQGVVISIAVHGLVLLILFLLQMSARAPKQPEGVTVSFGNFDQGGNAEVAQQTAEPVQEIEQPRAEPVAKTPPPVKEPAKKPAAKVLTADNSDAPAVKKQTQEEIDEAKRLAEAKELKRQQDLERERIEAENRRREELERQKAEEERKVKAQQDAQVSAIKGRMGKSFGGATGQTGEGAGDGQKSGNLGDPAGTVNTGKNAVGGGQGAGISYDLGGRSVIGSLAKPEYNINDYGTVVVQITVNKEGVVTSAVPGAKGSTTMDSRLLEAAKKAALQARFNKVTSPEAPTYQRGTITYHFKLM